jgi:hypothetical protein
VILVKHEGDGRRSGFRLRFSGLSLRDQAADPQGRWAGLTGRVLPVEFALVVRHVGAHLHLVFFSEGQDVGNQFGRTLEFLGDRRRRLAKNVMRFNDMEQPDPPAHHSHLAVGAPMQAGRQEGSMPQAGP